MKLGKYLKEKRSNIFTSWKWLRRLVRLTTFIAICFNNASKRLMLTRWSRKDGKQIFPWWGHKRKFKILSQQANQNLMEIGTEFRWKQRPVFQRRKRQKWKQHGENALWDTLRIAFHKNLREMWKNTLTKLSNNCYIWYKKCRNLGENRLRRENVKEDNEKQISCSLQLEETDKRWHVSAIQSKPTKIQYLSKL